MAKPKVPPGQVKHDTYTFGTLDTSSFDTKGDTDPSNDEMFFGDGNLPTNYNTVVDSKQGLELGLKIHYRQGDDILPTSYDPATGTAHYDVPAGTQVVDPEHNVPVANPTRAAWNFDFSVNTGVNGDTETLADYNFIISIASGDGETATFDMAHLGPGNTPWIGSDGGAFADEDGADPQLSQNSVNLGFGFFADYFGADALDAGETYTVTLQGFASNGQIIAQVTDILTLV